MQLASDASTAHVHGLAGCWKVAAGQALTLHAGQAGLLRIAHGRVWITFRVSSDKGPARTGDHILSRGESLRLEPGESFVIEPFALGEAVSAYFSWTPEAAPSQVAKPAVPVGWQGVREPIADLRVASGLVGRALAALARGVLQGSSHTGEAALSRMAMVFVAQRGRDSLTAGDLHRFGNARPGSCNVLAMSNLV